MTNKTTTTQVVPKLRFPEFENEKSWNTDIFDNLIEIIDGDRGVNYPKLSEFSNFGYSLFLNAKNVTKNGFAFEEMQFITKDKDEALRKGKLNRLDIVLTTRGSLGQFAFYSNNIPYENIRINSGMVILRIKDKEKISYKYLYEFCKSNQLRFHIKNIAFGNAQQQLTVKEIKKIPLHYSQLQEQQKIADCLSSLDEFITAQSQKLEALKQHKKGLMQNLFPVEGQTTPKLRFPEFENAGEWEEKKLGDTGQIVTGKTPSTKNTNLWNGDILFITPTDIDKDKKYQINTFRHITKQNDIKVLPVGSIIYTCIASIGKMAITTKPSITNQQINSVITNNSVINEYIYYSLIYLTPWIKSIPATSTLPIINKNEFSNFIIKIPKPQEQQKIADCLSSLDELITAQSQKIEALKQHKKGLMQNLFPQSNEIDYE